MDDQYEFQVINIEDEVPKDDYAGIAALLTEETRKGWEFITSDMGVLFFRRLL